MKIIQTGSTSQASAQNRISQKISSGNPLTVVSAGDSITQATFSSNYLSILETKLKGQHYEFVNAGRNGNTSGDLLKRIDKDVLARNPDFITILIGANDARQDLDLQPALQTYRQRLEKLISKIRHKTNVPVALISLAPLGENPYSQKNEAVRKFNAVLQEIAIEQNLGYLPLFEKLIPILVHKEPHDASEFKLNLFTALIKSAFKKYILRKSWDEISEDNGFSILTDGIHLNDQVGNILAGLIQEWLFSVNQISSANSC